MRLWSYSSAFILLPFEKSNTVDSNLGSFETGCRFRDLVGLVNNKSLRLGKTLTVGTPGAFNESFVQGL